MLTSNVANSLHVEKLARLMRCFRFLTFVSKLFQPLRSGAVHILCHAIFEQFVYPSPCHKLLQISDPSPKVHVGCVTFQLKNQ